MDFGSCQGVPVWKWARTLLKDQKITKGKKYLLQLSKMQKINGFHR